MTFLRVVISSILVKDLIVYFFSADYLFGPNAIVPYSMYHNILKLYNINFLEFNFNSLLLTRLYLLAGIGAGLAFLIGIRKVFFGLVLFVCLLLLKMRNIFILDGGDNLMQILLPFLAVSDSLPLLDTKKPTLSASDKSPSVRHTLAQLGNYGVMIEICYVYFFAFLHKLPGPLWLDGSATYYVMRTAEFQGTPLNIWLTQHALFVKFTTYSTLVWECLFPFLIWTKGTIKYALLVFSVLMHVGILIFMRIDNYSLVILASYCAFVTDSEFIALNNFYHSTRAKMALRTISI